MGMDLGGGFGAGGAVQGLQQLLAQRFAARQQAEHERAALAEEATKQQQLQEQTAYREMQQQELNRSHQESETIRRGAEANALGDQIPANSFIAPNDPAVGILQTGGRGALLSPQAARPEVTEGPLQPGDTGAARAQGFLKLPSAKQTDTEADNARQAGQAKETQRHDRAMENKPGALVTVQTMDANGNPVTRIVPKVAGAEFAKPDQATAQNRARAEVAKSIMPHIDTVEREAKELQTLGLIGPMVGRWRDLVAGKIGAGEVAGGDAVKAGKIGKFLTDIKLLKSATAMAHGGARAAGSPAMLEYMNTVLNQDADLPTLLGSTSSLREWMQGYADIGAHGHDAGKAAAPKLSAADLIKKYGG